MIHADIGDDIAAFVIVALQPQAERRADRRARAVGGEHVIRIEAVVAGGRGDIERDAIVAALDAGKFALPAHVDEIAGRDRIMQILFDVLLLQIVHRQIFFALGMRHLEPKNLLAAVVAAAKAPAERLFEEGRDRADPLQDMHARPCDADGAAAVIKGVLAVDQHGANAMARQRQRRGHADRSRADDHDGVPRGRAVKFGRALPPEIAGSRSRGNRADLCRQVSWLASISSCGRENPASSAAARRSGTICRTRRC